MARLRLVAIALPYCCTYRIHPLSYQSDSTRMLLGDRWIYHDSESRWEAQVSTCLGVSAEYVDTAQACIRALPCTSCVLLHRQKNHREAKEERERATQRAWSGYSCLFRLRAQILISYENNLETPRTAAAQIVELVSYMEQSYGIISYH